MANKKKCKQCEVAFTPKYRVTERYWAKRKYCSVECRRLGEKGKRRSTYGTIRVPLEERFWSKVDKRGLNECWEWQGAREAGGYGFLHSSERPKRWKKAHRLSYEMAKGEIPKGMCVCHTCDNPPCVNPNHLWLGTLAENNEDKRVKGRLGERRGELNGRAKLSESDVKCIKQLRGTGMTQQQIADIYGISQNAVSRVLSNKSWSHLLDI